MTEDKQPLNEKKFAEKEEKANDVGKVTNEANLSMETCDDVQMNNADLSLWVLMIQTCTFAVKWKIS